MLLQNQCHYARHFSIVLSNVFDPNLKSLFIELFEFMIKTTLFGGNGFTKRFNALAI